MHCRQVQVQIDTRKYCRHEIAAAAAAAAVKALSCKLLDIPSATESRWLWRAFCTWEDSDAGLTLSKFGNTVFKSIQLWPNSAPPIIAGEIVLTKDRATAKLNGPESVSPSVL